MDEFYGGIKLQEHFKNPINKEILPKNTFKKNLGTYKEPPHNRIMDWS